MFFLRGGEEFVYFRMPFTRTVRMASSLNELSEGGNWPTNPFQLAE